MFGGKGRPAGERTLAIEMLVSGAFVTIDAVTKGEAPKPVEYIATVAVWTILGAITSLYPPVGPVCTKIGGLVVLGEMLEPKGPGRGFIKLLTPDKKGQTRISKLVADNEGQSTVSLDSATQQQSSAQTIYAAIQADQQGQGSTALTSNPPPDGSSSSTAPPTYSLPQSPGSGTTTQPVPAGTTIA